MWLYSKPISPLIVCIEKHQFEFSEAVFQRAESKLFLPKNKWCVAFPLTPQSDGTVTMVTLLGQSAQQVPVQHLHCRRVPHSGSE